LSGASIGGNDPAPNGRTSEVTCVCGIGETTEAHCLPLIKGEKMPDTAEALMRSRYAAYVLGEIDYVLSTHTPDASKDVDRDSTEAWSKNSQWLGLEVVSTDAGSASDERGAVEFIARYKVKGLNVQHHELAEFVKVDGRWLYKDGKEISPPPVKREGPRVGRNDPCPCGSGKKYKKCHGQAA
jgi:SEC-C motif-containing protein